MQKEFLILSGRYIPNKLSFFSESLTTTSCRKDYHYEPPGIWAAGFLWFGFFYFHQSIIMFFIIFRGCEIMKRFPGSIKCHAMVNVGMGLWVQEKSSCGLSCAPIHLYLCGITCLRRSTMMSCFCPRSYWVCVVCVCVHIRVLWGGVANIFILHAWLYTLLMIGFPLQCCPLLTSWLQTKNTHVGVFAVWTAFCQKLDS